VRQAKRRARAKCRLQAEFFRAATGEVNRSPVAAIRAVAFARRRNAQVCPDFQDAISPANMPVTCLLPRVPPSTGSSNAAGRHGDSNLFFIPRTRQRLRPQKPRPAAMVRCALKVARTHMSFFQRRGLRAQRCARYMERVRQRCPDEQRRQVVMNTAQATVPANQRRCVQAVLQRVTAQTPPWLRRRRSCV